MWGFKTKAAALGLGPRVLGSTVWRDYRNDGASNRNGNWCLYDEGNPM